MTKCYLVRGKMWGAYSRCRYICWLFLGSTMVFLLNLLQLLQMSAMTTGRMREPPEVNADAERMLVYAKRQLREDADFADLERSEDRWRSSKVHGSKPWHNDSLNSNVPQNNNMDSIWPQPLNESEDRILNQLHFRPRDFHPSPDPFEGSKTILLKNGYPRGVYPGNLVFQRDKCPVQRCLLTDNPVHAISADAVLFQGSFSPPYPSNLKPPDQVWIFYQLESPLHTLPLGPHAHLINWTATYRRDSTIVTPYEKFVLSAPVNSSHDQELSKNYAEHKSKMVAWFVSNCDTTNRRWEYVQELRKYIQVDIYGACGTLECPRSQEDRCNRMLQKDYKFYLAFENSNCVDYITEKFFRNALANEVVPVVMGARPKDYAKVAPPHSYIHVDHFESPKHLAEYLHHLDNNDYLYNEYFRWKNKGYFIDTKFWCRLCLMIHQAQDHVTWVKDIDAWWKAPDVCVQGRPWSSWRHKRRHGSKGR